VNSVIDTENSNGLEDGEAGVRDPYHLQIAVGNLLIPFWPAME
jgi:hypothetical protein